MDIQSRIAISPEVKEAIEQKKPVVALESVAITSGLPYPQNYQVGIGVEKILRQNGVVPATMAIIKGMLHIGLNENQIKYLCEMGPSIEKSNRKDIPIMLALGKDAAFTISSTLMVAEMVGIDIVMAGGCGGVHLGGQDTMDISADLDQLAQSSVMLVCAGPKAILDLKLTKEYLETKGVPIIGLGVDELPALFTRDSGVSVDFRIDNVDIIAAAFRIKKDLMIKGGMLVAYPISEEYSVPGDLVFPAIKQAHNQALLEGIHGKAITPYILSKISKLVEGSLEASVNLQYSTASAAADIAKSFYLNN